MKVAVAQFASKPDAPANRARALELLRTAAGSGAELVVLPEAAMYPTGRPPAELAQAAEALDGPFVTALAGAAGELGVSAIAGMFEKVPGGQRVHNTAVAVDATGLLGCYRKLHLYDALGHRESDALVPGRMDGDELLTLALGDFVIGVATCYDLRFPELFRALVDRGATAFAVPAAWVAGPLKQEHWVTMCRARAIENTSYLMTAAQPPPTYCGHSLVIDPMGIELARLGETEGVAIAEISSEHVRSVREALPVLLQRRYEVRPRP
ncbi:MAG: carbon-nitrogen hydrolase family protein [Acidimicrobiales bacterium]